MDTLCIRIDVKGHVIGSCRRAWLSRFGADLRLLIVCVHGKQRVNVAVDIVKFRVSVVSVSMNVEYFKLFDLETTGTLTYGFSRLIAK